MPGESGLSGCAVWPGRSWRWPLGCAGRRWPTELQLRRRAPALTQPPGMSWAVPLVMAILRKSVATQVPFLRSTDSAFPFPGAQARNEALRACKCFGRASGKDGSGSHRQRCVEARMTSQVLSHLWRLPARGQAPEQVHHGQRPPQAGCRGSDPHRVAGAREPVAFTCAA